MSRTLQGHENVQRRMKFGDGRSSVAKHLDPPHSADGGSTFDACVLHHTPKA